MISGAAEVASQGRIADIVTQIDRIVENPLVTNALGNTEHTPGIGWGLAEYRAGRGLLSTGPRVEGEVPAEIAYYPEVPSKGVFGAIYWHGPKSHRLEEGKLVSFHFDDRVEDGHY